MITTTKESAARKMLKDFKSLIAFAEAVEELGKVEAERDAAVAERDAAQAEATNLGMSNRKAKEQLEAAKNAAGKLEAERAEVINAAKAGAQIEADNILDDAGRKADAMIGEARQQAGKIVGEARQSVETQKRAHEKWKEEAARERAKIEAETAELEKGLAKLRKKVMV